MKSRTLFTVAVWMVSLAEFASAQVLPAGRVGLTGGVQPASCTTCAGGTHGFYDGIVAGAPCMDCKVRPKLFPPCPQPCQTTLLAEVVYDVKHVVDTGLSSLFCCLLGDTGFGCGCHGVCTCEEPYYASIDQGTQEYIIESDHVPPSVMQPTPQSNGGEPDPFRDDPPSMQPIPNNSTTQVRRPATKSVVQPTRTVPQVQQASHVDRAVPTPPRSIQLTSLEAAPLPAEAAPLTQPAVAPDADFTPPPVAGHYVPRRATSLRRVDGAQLRKASVQVQSGTPTLRFREVD